MDNENFVSWLFSQAAKNDPNRPLLHDAQESATSVTYTTAEVVDRTKRVIAGLRAIGIGRGDCVCIHGFNSVHYNILFLGIIGAGAIFSGLNPSYPPAEIQHHLKLTHAKAIIVEPSLLDSVLAAIESLDFDRSRILTLDRNSFDKADLDIRSWTTLLHHGLADLAHIDDAQSAVAAYASTSGTTGLPKAAKLGHSYLREQARMYISPSNVDYEVRRLIALPPFHVFCMPVVFSSIAQGCPTYIMPRLELAPFLAAVAQYRISETLLPPPVLTGLPRSPLASRAALSSLRQVWTGGAGITYQNQSPLYDLLRPDAQINQVWGMTEIGWAATSRWGQKQCNDSCGRMIEGYEVKIINANQDGAGEVLVHCPTAFLGYSDNSEATAEAFCEDGYWVYTGDIGFVKDDCVYIIDRKKELIKVRGWQVSPAEVESILLRHPSVADVAVIGLPIDNGKGAGEEFARAYVVTTAGSTDLTQEDLGAFAAQSLAKYKLPAEYVFVAGIPKNSTGKILRRLLREEARNLAQSVSDELLQPRNCDPLRESITTSVGSFTKDVAPQLGRRQRIRRRLTAAFRSLLCFR